MNKSQLYLFILVNIQFLYQRCNSKRLSKRWSEPVEAAGHRRRQGGRGAAEGAQQPLQEAKNTV